MGGKPMQKLTIKLIYFLMSLMIVGCAGMPQKSNVHHDERSIESIFQGNYTYFSNELPNITLDADPAYVGRTILGHYCSNGSQVRPIEYTIKVIIPKLPTAEISPGKIEKLKKEYLNEIEKYARSLFSLGQYPLDRSSGTKNKLDNVSIDFMKDTSVIDMRLEHFYSPRSVAPKMDGLINLTTLLRENISINKSVGPVFEGFSGNNKSKFIQRYKEEPSYFVDFRMINFGDNEIYIIPGSINGYTNFGARPGTYFSYPRISNISKNSYDNFTDKGVYVTLPPISVQTIEKYHRFNLSPIYASPLEYKEMDPVQDEHITPLILKEELISNGLAKAIVAEIPEGVQRSIFKECYNYNGMKVRCSSYSKDDLFEEKNKKMFWGNYGWNMTSIKQEESVDNKIRTYKVSLDLGPVCKYGEVQVP